ncbi:hypothetical protein MNBD_NITROSPINAE02-1814 [hydrothermal vent metagenome]|uniref:ATP-grasp domain-containing protein n=1 Tax=hydrothermal vent metagenome TaxID=652676 RepID=A0A3B1CVI7_9ZZZZ
MKKNINILITATSRRVAMIRGFQRAIRELGLSGSVQATDTDRLSSGLRFCDKFHIVPLSGSKKYLSAILDICKKEKIDIVVPTIDEELEIFGQHKDDFEAIGVIALVSKKSVGEICNDKYLTAKFFEERRFPFAETFLPDEIDFGSVKYPLFIKPRIGRGGVHAFPVRSETELKFFIDYIDGPVIQRYLKGAEYTVDVCAGLDGRILSVVPRERLVIRSGVCDRGRTVKDKEIIDISKQICEELEIVGPVNLQCIKENKKITFFEINPRFSGAIQLTVAAGADFFAMIIKEALGIAQKPVIGEFKDELVMMSYEESLFESMGK